MRFVIALMAFLATVAPARTQPKAPEFVQSEQAFNSLPIDTRITFQVLLTAEGYWPAVPNVNYSGRLYDAVRRFQSDHGFRPTGMLNAAELDKLLDVATPMLKMWEFQGVGHPDRGRPIWVPFGLGLQVERVNGGIRWRPTSDRPTPGVPRGVKLRKPRRFGKNFYTLAEIDKMVIEKCPVPPKGAHLYLRRRSGREPTFVIRDGGHEVGTGCAQNEHGEAEKRKMTC